MNGWIIQSCRKGAIDVEQIAAKVPHYARQDLLQNLEQREFIKVIRRGAADVQLTQVGQNFLRSYRPRGCQAVLSFDLLTNYLNFMALAGPGGVEFEFDSVHVPVEAKPLAQAESISQTTAIA